MDCSYGVHDRGAPASPRYRLSDLSRAAGVGPFLKGGWLFMSACQVSNADAARADRREEVAIKTIAQGGCVTPWPSPTDQDSTYLGALRAGVGSRQLCRLP